MGDMSIGDGQPPPYAKVHGGPVDDLEFDDILALRPKVHDLISRHRRDAVFCKTHNACISVKDYPLITPEVTLGAFYVMRDPRDVAPSLAHHFGVTIDKAIDSMDQLSSTDSSPPFTVFSSWSRHVESWVDAPGMEHRHVLVFEDMKNKSYKTFKGVLEFLAIKPEKERLKRAIRFSSFKTLKAIEQKKGFKEQSDKNNSFFRKGKTGGWKETLTPGQVERIEHDHGEVMERFGYLEN